MKRKFVTLSLAACAAVCLCFGLTACRKKGDDGTKHTHTYAAEWSYDGTYHWHTATCEHTDEVSGKAEHTYVNDVCSVCGHEQGTPVSNGLKFTLNKDKSSYSVTGIGTCTDSNVIIPAIYNNLPVTSIGNYAFKNGSSLTSVTMGSGVTNIGAYAFSGCTSLTSITISDSVTSISEYAFEGCSKLTSITIPDSVTSISNSVFLNCSSLNYNEYDNAYYLGNETNPYVVLVKAKETSITSCSINTNTKVIYGSAFYDCRSLTSITIPDSVTSIGNAAFKGCSKLTSVTIPDSVTSISDYAFSSCSGLTSVTIPDSVTSIGSAAFNGCSKLTDITFNGTLKQWVAIATGYNWNYGTGAYILHCTDGDIAKK